MKPTIKPKRTAEQRAEEESVRQQHAVNPVRQRPASAINQQSFTAILSLVTRFKAVRESQGLTLAEVAERMGIDAPALSRLETGKMLNPTLATLHKWAEALGQKLDVDLSELLATISSPRSNISPVLYIIESPNPVDILDGRKEGEALMMSLRLAEIKSIYFQIANQQMLEKVMRRISDDLQQRGDTVFIPVIHISAHGNERGIALTSEEVISWETLGNLLYDLKGRMGLSTVEPGTAVLAMSTCQGLHGYQVSRSNSRAPFSLMFGPTKNVEWADSLTAWITLYHLFLKKNFQLEKAIAAMNIAAGLEPRTFAVISGKSIEDQLRTQTSTALDQ